MSASEPPGSNDSGDGPVTGLAGIAAQYPDAEDPAGAGDDMNTGGDADATDSPGGDGNSNSVSGGPLPQPPLPQQQQHVPQQQQHVAETVAPPGVPPVVAGGLRGSGGGVGAGGGVGGAYYAAGRAAPVHYYEPPVFDKVRGGLAKSATVGWDLAVKSFTQARQWVEEEETQSFIRDCFHQVTSILLDQQISKIGQHERSCVERSLDQAIVILVWLMSHAQRQFVRTLCLMFDSNRPFYKGHRSPHWSYQVGAPEVRLRCIDTFFRHEGVDALLELLRVVRAQASVPAPQQVAGGAVLQGPAPAPVSKSVAAGWMGAEQTQILVQAMTESKVLASSTDDIEGTTYLCKLIMEQMLLLSEDELKKELSETIGDILRALKTIMGWYGPENSEEVFDFWLQLTLKYLRSGSLPLRLFGWEQVPELIETAGEARPPPREYVVEGAGTEKANGRYRYSGTGQDGSPKYTIEVAEGTPEPERPPNLTLFRCTMRNKTKNWFISVAHPDSPGTDKDVDYYQHKTLRQDEQEPPRHGWMTAVCTGASGKDPPPVLTPVGRVIPEGHDETDTLEHQVAKWAIANRVVEDVFGSGIHREVVSRSTPLLKFLSQMPGYLTAAHIDLIWAACVGKAEVELQSEVYALLATLMRCAAPELVVYLINKVNAAANMPATPSSKSEELVVGSGNGAGATALAEAVELVQRLAASHAHTFLWASEAVGSAMLELLWSLLQKPALARHKAGNAITQFFGTMLHAARNSAAAALDNSAAMLSTATASAAALDSSTAQLPPGRGPYAHQHRYLQQCLEYVERRGLDGEAVLSESEEQAIRRALQLARFIFDTFDPRDVGGVVCELAGVGTADMEGESLGLQQLLLAELEAFRARYPRRVGKHIPAESAEALLLEQVQQRLEILRYLHGASEAVKLSVQQLQRLWDILSMPQERELYMAFLQGASEAGDSAQMVPHVAPLKPPAALISHQIPLAAFGPFELAFVFSQLICGQADWTHLGHPAYSCFYAFFVHLSDLARDTAPITAVTAEVIEPDDMADSSAQVVAASAAVAVPPLPLREAHRLGVETLWRIVLTTGDKNVADTATRDLLSVYTRSAVDEERSTARQDLVGSIFERLQAVLNDMRQALSSGGTAAVQQQSTAQYSAQSVHVRGQRLLKLLQEAIEAAEGDMSPKHGERADSVKRTLTVSLRRTGRCAPPSHYLPKGLRPLQVVRSREHNQFADLEPFDVEVHPLDTVATLKSRIIWRHGTPAIPYQMRVLIKQGLRSLALDKTRVLSCGVEEGAELIVNINPKLGVSQGVVAGPEAPAAVPRGEVGIPEGHLHMGDAIAQHDGYFDVLFGLLEQARLAKDQPTASAVWSLLMKLPTDSVLLDHVLQAGGVVKGDSAPAGSQAAMWQHLVSPALSVYKLVYVLQIVDALLVPAAPLAAHPWAQASPHFQDGFVTSGGFKAVLETLLHTPAEGDASYYWVNCLALKIMRTCLLGAGASGFGDVVGAGHVAGAGGEGGGESDAEGATPRTAVAGVLGQLSMGGTPQPSMSTPEDTPPRHTEPWPPGMGASKGGGLGGNGNGGAASGGLSGQAGGCAEGEESVVGVSLAQLLEKTIQAGLAAQHAAMMPDAIAAYQPTPETAKTAAAPPNPGDAQQQTAAAQAHAPLPSTSAKLLLAAVQGPALSGVMEEQGVDKFTLYQTVQCGLVVFRAALRRAPAAAARALQTSAARKWLVSVSLCSTHMKVRQAMSELAVELATELGSMDPGIFQWLTEPLVHLSPTDSQCTQYFMALDQVLELMLRAFLAGDAPAEGEMADAAGASAERRAVEGQLQALGQALSVKLMVLRRESAHATEGAGSSRGGIDGGASSTLVLQCCLVLLTRLLKGAPEGMMPLAGTELGENLIGHVFGSMLFALPQSATVTVTAATTAHPLCEGNGPRAAAFQVLLAAAGRDTATALPQLLYMCGNMMSGATPGLRSCWHVETSADGNRGGSGYVGLKNQGCTCYMNSLLQQLFMVPAFREAICSAAPMPRPSDASLPEDPAQWVGRRLMMQFESQQPMQAKVMGYQPDTGMHTIRYTTIRPPATAPGTAPGTVPEASAENSDDEGQGIVHTFVLRSGRPGKETGIFTPLPKVHKGSSAVVPQRNLTDKEKEKEAEDEHTRLLLEQVQRTFCYLNDSQTRYFDPRPLVEVCKCLNLQYSVYHQNDASEFCTKLLDRLETAVKGDSAKALANCFGGRLVQEKIPRGCSHRTSREDPFIALELIIRGKESIQESLAALVEGELMEGDNKVECDKCGTKKDSMRRTSLGALPNLLILHLKRFDLDYTTFETVKLNNRCEFPLTLDVKPYTQEGIEEKEALQLALDKAVSSAGGDLTLDELQTLKHTHSQQVMTGPADGGPVAGATGPASVPSTPKGAAVGATPDAATQAADAEYLYELKGILVHAGVAQGGHYYSFIKERQPRTGREPKWFKFDDDDVLPFDPANIETCCFGGMGPVQGATSWRGSGNSSSTAVTVPMEQERVANALMLFYEKVTPKPLPVEPAPATAKTVEGAPLAPPAVAAVTATEPATAAAVGTASSMDTATGGTAGPAGLRLSRICEAFTREVWLSNLQLSRICEAFMREVWLSSLQQTVQSYVLDRGFHSFVYELVNMALAAGDANADATSTCQAPQQGSSGSKRKALSPEHSAEPAPQADMMTDEDVTLPTPDAQPTEASGTSLHSRATALGVTALLDVMLHANDRCKAAGRKLQLLLSTAMAADPLACRQFAANMLKPSASRAQHEAAAPNTPASASGYLRQFIFECVDDNARALSCKLFASAICALAASVEAEESDAAAASAAAATVSGGGGGGGGALLRELLRQLLQQLGEIPEYHRHGEQVFMLLRDVAAGSDLVRRWLVGEDAIAQVSMFITRKLTAPKLQEAYPLIYQNQIQSSTQRHRMRPNDFIYAPEAIAVMMGLRVPDREELVCKDTSASERADPSEAYRATYGENVYADPRMKLTEKCERVLCDIFKAFAVEDEIDAKGVWEYLHAVHMNNSDQSTVKSVLNQFAQSEQTQNLTLAGFLEWYRVKISGLALVDSVWQELATQDYGPDLNKILQGKEWTMVQPPLDKPASPAPTTQRVSQQHAATPSTSAGSDGSGGGGSGSGSSTAAAAAPAKEGDGMAVDSGSPPMEGSRGAAAAATTDSAGGSATSAQQQSSTPPAAAVAAAAAADAEPIPPLSQHALCEYALYGEAFSGGAFWPLPIGCAIARRVCSAYQAQFTSQRLLDSCLFQLARQPAIPPAATAYYGSYDADDVALTNLVKLLTAILDIEDQYQVQRLQYACWESQLGLVKAGGHLAAIQQMEAGQQLASLRGARYLQQQQQLTALWAVVDQYGRAVMQLANACAAFSRFLHQRVRGEDLAWVREVDTKRSINFNSVYNRQQQYTNRDQQYSDNDSNENDNDSDYYSSGSTPNIIGYTVHGAGVREVNGDYHRCSEKSDNCPMYEMPTEFHGQQVSFQLFRCRLDQQHQRWYLSIVPQGQRPGTNQDIDFYEASVTRDMANSMYPPTGKDAWVATAEMSKPYAHLYTREQREPPPELLPCAEVDDGNSSEDLHQREVQRHVGRRTGGQGPRGSAPPSRPSGNQQSAADSRVSAPTSSVLPGPVVTAGSGIAGLPGSPNAPGSDELYASFDTRMMPRGGAAVGSPQAADAELEINEYDDGSSLRAEGDSDFSGELDDDSDGAIHSPPSPQQQQRQEQVLPPQRPTRTRGRGPVDSFPASDTF